MGAAGKRREEELLAKIAALEGTVRERDNQIGDYEAQIAGLREQIKINQKHSRTRRLAESCRTTQKTREWKYNIENGNFVLRYRTVSPATA